MRRVLSLLVTALLALVRPAPGQTTPAGGTWQAGLGLDGIHFAESLTDTLVPSDAAAGLRPDGRLGLRGMISRSFGGWRAELELGWAAGRVEAGNESVTIKDKTTRVTRWRLAASIDRRVARVGPGELGVAAGPTIDWWSVAGSDRARAGAEGRLALRVPVGALVVENRLAVGVSGCPLVPADAGPGFRSRPQLAVTAGVGLHLGL